MKVRKLLAMLLVLSMVLSITLPTAVLAAEGESGTPVVTETESTPVEPAPEEPDAEEPDPEEPPAAETAPAETAPVETDPAPTESTPAETTPVETAPVPTETTPAETTPVETAPVPTETTPVETTPVETAPVPTETTPAETTPVETTPVPTETVVIPETTPPMASCPHGSADPATCPECHPELYCPHGVLLTEECAQCIAAQQAHEAAMAVAKSVYEKIMAATTLEEYAAAKVVDPMYQSSIDALLAEYVATLTEDQQAAYAEHVEKLLNPILSFETVEEIYAAIMAAATKADYDAILAAITDEQKAELEAYVLTLTPEEQAAYAEKIAALTASVLDGEAIYNMLMATTTLREYREVQSSLSNEDWEVLFGFFTEETRTMLSDHFKMLTDSVKLDVVSNSVPAPFLDSVPSVETMAPMARSTSVMSLMNAPISNGNIPETHGSEDGNPDGLELDKRVIDNGDGTYTLHLESYVTGNITIDTEETTKPADIVLVLDVSGSMDDDIEVGYGPSSLNYLDTGYGAAEGVYSAVFYKVPIINMDITADMRYVDGKWQWQSRIFSGGWTDCADQKITLNVPLMGQQTVDVNLQEIYVSKINALKIASTNFVTSVRESGYGADGTPGTGDDVEHRISLVTYASNANTVLGLTDADSELLTEKIKGLKANGATGADYGMAAAEDVINGINRESTKAVIMFTDGEPNHGNGFDTTVANNTISTSKDIKATGATVYTVGVFNGADDTVPMAGNADNMNKYMHYVSSNFKNATSMGDGGNPTYPEGENESYYLAAANADELDSVFQMISDNIQSGGASVTLTSSTIVQDVISEQFQLPEGTDESNIDVYTMDATAAALNAPDADGSWTNRKDLSSDQVTIDGNAIQYTGFDFSLNFVADKGRVEGDPSQSGDFYGRKLVIEIPIEVEDGFFGGNNIDTNAEGSGIYANEENLAEGNATGTFTSPNLTLPLDYQFEGTEQSIYLTQAANGDYLFDFADGYEPDGWNNSYVTLTYKVYDTTAGEKLIGSYVVDQGKPAAQGYWIDGNAPDLSGLNDCNKYGVTCTVTPNEGTGNDSVGTANWEETELQSVESNVHVFKPTVSFGDQSTYLTVDPGENTTYNTTWSDGADPSHTAAAKPSGNAPELTITSAAAGNADKTEDYVKTVTVKIGEQDVTNYTTLTRTHCTGDSNTPAVSNGQYVVHVFKPSITWKDSKKDFGYQLTSEHLTADNKVGDVIWSHANTNVAQPTVQAPTLTYTFTDPDGNSLPGTLAAETNVKVTVKVGEADITDETTFSWRKGEGCPNTCTDPNPNYQFRIHLNNFDLTVTKHVTDNKTYDADDTFRFTLTKDGAVYTTFTLKAGESATFKNLQAGPTYTVVEDTDWSWRYTCTGGDTKNVTVTGGTAEVVFTNELTKDHWLSDEASENNVFDSVNAHSTRMSDAMLPESVKMPKVHDESDAKGDEAV